MLVALICFVILKEVDRLETNAYFVEIGGGVWVIQCLIWIYQLIRYRLNFIDEGSGSTNVKNFENQNIGVNINSDVVRDQISPDQKVTNDNSNDKSNGSIESGSHTPGGGNRSKRERRQPAKLKSQGGHKNIDKSIKLGNGSVEDNEARGKVDDKVIQSLND